MKQLTSYIQRKRESQPILLMTHVVYGYPTIPESLEIMEMLLKEGVELLEVQFPFSDPVADGPVITEACHVALEQKVTLNQCIEDISALANTYPESRVLLMSYLNPLIQIGFDHLAEKLSPSISGMIIPDLPIDHKALATPLTDKEIPIIWIVTPGMEPSRIQKITDQAAGMLYCVSRAGVTGQTNSPIDSLESYLNSIRALTPLPLAVGFGISTREDVAMLENKADVAIVGSALLRAFHAGGIKQVKRSLLELKGSNA